MPLMRTASRVDQEPHHIPFPFAVITLFSSLSEHPISGGSTEWPRYGTFCPPWLAGSEVGLSMVRRPPGMEEKRLGST